MRTKFLSATVEYLILVIFALVFPGQCSQKLRSFGRKHIFRFRTRLGHPLDVLLSSGRFVVEFYGLGLS